LYCSELISDAWKVVNGKPLGKFVLFKELKWQKYRKVIEQFEGSKTIPLERKLITPRDLAKAEELEFQMAKDFKRE